MAYIKRIDEMASRKADAEKAAREAKACFRDGDIEGAARAWCAIYSMYEGDTSMESFSELNSVMRMFTDDEVYTITDWLKENGLDESFDFSRVRSGRLFESSAPELGNDMYACVEATDFNRKAYGKAADGRVKDILTRTQNDTVMTIGELRDDIEYVANAMGCDYGIRGDDEFKSYWCKFFAKSSDYDSADVFGDDYIGYINFALVRYPAGFDMDSYIRTMR